MADQCRWGVLGAANIARKNWKSIRNAENCTLTGVASRDVARAEQFIDECMLDTPFPTRPTAFGSYQDLLDSDVDAVYIPLPTALRKEWVIKTAEAGKHVMCEKPCAITAADLEEMVAACREHNVQFMDGVMFMHSKRLDAVREAIDDGSSVGQLRRIASQFSFCGDDDFLNHDIRLSEALEPDGCLGDLGWYTIRFTLWVMNYAMPNRVAARLLKTASREDSGEYLPLEFSAEMFFDDAGVSASFFCAFTIEHQQWVHLSGSQGNLQLNDFVLPYFGPTIDFEVNNAAFNIYGCDFNMERHRRTVSTSEYSSGHANAQETNLFRNFARLALSGSPDNHWPDIALKTQRVMDAVRESARADGKMLTLS